MKFQTNQKLCRRISEQVFTGGPASSTGVDDVISDLHSNTARMLDGVVGSGVKGLGVAASSLASVMRTEPTRDIVNINDPCFDDPEVKGRDVNVCTNVGLNAKISLRNGC